MAGGVSQVRKRKEGTVRCSRLSVISVRVAGMARVAFDRAIAGMGTPQKQADDAASTEAAAAAGEIDPNESVIVLTDEIQAVRMHQLAISLRPLPGTTGRPMLTASRWEVRKAIMSLCCTPPTMFEVITL